MVHIVVRKPRIAVVSSASLGSKSLRAEAYVFSPRRESQKLIDAWVRDNKSILNRRSVAVQDLEKRIQTLLEEALASGTSTVGS